MNRNDRPILMVEDNPDDVELTKMALRDAGIRNPIHVASDGVEALEYLFGTDEGKSGSPADPIVTLLDLQLPRVDGFQVLERIRADERTKRLPVVILTSSDAEEDIARGYALGVNSYVRKPVEFAQFAKAVRQLGVYWLLINEPVR